MKKNIKNIDLLSDSRIMFEKKLPAFGYILVIVVTIFLILAFFWSIKMPKIYMIQAEGIVTNLDANYVMSTYTGEILDCYMKEGILVEEGDLLFTVKSADYDLQEQQLLMHRQAYERQTEKYKLLVKSIEDDINYFDETKVESGLYYDMFEKYKAQVAQNVVDVSMYKAYGYDESQIELELVKNQAKISEIYFSTLQSVESKIEEIKIEIDLIDAQLATIYSGQKLYEVKATTSGILHLLADYKRGMIVQTTDTIATITPENVGHTIVAYVSTADMVRIEEGDAVQIEIDGLSQSIYGYLDGKVKQIDSNVTARQGSDGNTIHMFKVLIEVEEDYLVSNNGNKVDISNGMTAIVRIQYDEVTYFNYVIEKLGYKAK